jgi:hypothetical protein
MKLSRFVSAAAAAVVMSGAAFAGDLTGTDFELFINHTGPFGENVGGTYTYGTFEEFFDSFGFSWSANSPNGTGGFDNSVLIDFANFAYGDFAGETATVDITGLDIDPQGGSFAVLNANGADIGFNYTSGSGALGAQYLVNSVIDTGVNTVVLAWDNVVPAPGALALLGIAGIAGRRRRRA